MKQLCLSLLLVSSAAFAQDTIRICDASGCSDRPRNTATFEAELAAQPDPAQNPKLLALEAMAAKDPRAAYDLGLRFFRGDGVKKDGYLAIKWMRDAGERGDNTRRLKLKSPADLGTAGTQRQAGQRSVCVGGSERAGGVDVSTGKDGSGRRMYQCGGQFQNLARLRAGIAVVGAPGGPQLDRQRVVGVKHGPVHLARNIKGAGYTNSP